MDSNRNKQLISDLNELVEINNDRIEGYKAAIKETEQEDLKTLFKNLVEHSFNLKNELSAEIMRLGGEPVSGTRASGKLYRAWMDLKAALTRKERGGILSSCEYGEDVALETYDDVLKQDSLSPTARYMVMKQRDLLKKDHDNIRNLRDNELRRQAR